MSSFHCTKLTESIISGICCSVKSTFYTTLISKDYMILSSTLRRSCARDWRNLLKRNVFWRVKFSQTTLWKRNHINRMLQFHCRLNLLSILSICTQLVILSSPAETFSTLTCASFDWVASSMWINNSCQGITIALCRWPMNILRRTG